MTFCLTLQMLKSEAHHIVQTQVARSQVTLSHQKLSAVWITKGSEKLSASLTIVPGT